jgi:Protein of unknown function (DUF1553)/Protein of unknown function (DUF1549)
VRRAIAIALCFGLDSARGLAAEPNDVGAKPATPDATPPASLHFAYRPLGAPPLPEVRDVAWICDPLDRFVLAALEARGLAPAPECDRRTFARRASYDLIGLPPSMEDVAAFEADASPDAFETFVDRLLASPHYGERHGRLWLQLVRYADSNGSDENLVLGEAWRYRDYVVDSFNADKPLDRFVTEQLAGDLLPACEGDPADAARVHRERIIATGFLALGPKMLAEPDREKLALDTVDEQIDVVSRSLLGSTLSCARCHDHPFDPYTQQDYQAFAGIFRSTSVFDAPADLARWRERDLGTATELEERAKFKQERDAAQKRLDDALETTRNLRRAELLRELGRAIALVGAEAACTIRIEAEDFTSATLHVDRETHGTKEVPVVTSNREGTQFAEYRCVVPAPGRYAIELRYAAGDSRPLRGLVDGNVIAENVAKDATGGFKLDSRRWTMAGEFDAIAGADGIVAPLTLRLDRGLKGPQHFPHLDTLLVRPVAPSWPRDEDRFGPSDDVPFLRAVLEWLALGERAPGRDGVARAGEVAAALEALPEPKAALADAALEALRKAWLAEPGPLPPRIVADETRWRPEREPEIAALRAELAALDARKPADLPRALTAIDDKIVDLPLYVRGNHHAKEGDPIPRGLPATFAALAPAPTIAPNTSGRLELARWLFDPRNPLPSRVFANRIWGNLFGIGIVPTASEFGARGEAPTHPELLDFLATSLVDSGWSYRALLRRIVLSATYRMSAETHSEVLAHDPDARFFSRLPTKRLDADQLRDAMLAVAGKLDPQLGGSLVTFGNREYLPGDPSSDRAKFGAPRRSIYLPIYRNATFDYFAMFDAPDPASACVARTETTVAPQALWLHNSPFALDMAEAFARAVLAEASDDAARIAAAWSRAYQRAPTQRETERVELFLAEARAAATKAKEPDVTVFTALCQTLFARAEFVEPAREVTQ